MIIWESTITEHTVDVGFILIDVREVSEVKDGIIASEFCKPYHMAWTSGEFTQDYTQLPKEIPIIVYCGSGNRSMQAATFLVENGFTTVASIAQGIDSYDQSALEDSTEFKPLSDLPAFSYPAGTTSISMIRSVQKQQAVIITDAARPDGQINLQGRAHSRQAHQRNAPVYILERIGEESTGSVQGIGRRLQHDR